MLLQLDPDKMAQLGITVSDVADAVREQNATNPAGRLGREPAPPGTRADASRSRRSAGSRRPTQFNDIVVRARAGRLAGAARATSAARCSGAQSYDFEGRLNGTADRARACSTCAPAPTRCAARDAVVGADGRAGRRLSRRACTYSIPFDTTPFVTASIKEVVITLARGDGCSWRWWCSSSCRAGARR